MDEKEKERREAFMKTYGVTEEEMGFFEYVYNVTHTMMFVIIVLAVLLVLVALAAAML